MPHFAVNLKEVRTVDWTELKIYTSSQGVDALTGRLMNIGISGFVIQDKNDFEDFLQHKDGNWDYIDDDLYELRNAETSVTVYISNDADGMEMLSMIKEQLGTLKALDQGGEYGRLECEFSSVREEDWANNWKKYFKPLKIGDRLLIKPSWEQTQPIDRRVVVEIDPAASFGTGQHNTTQLCLELLEENIQQGDKLLDLGCGSGILSVSGVMLGAFSAYAVDIEQGAVNIAAENAAKNGISKDRYTAVCGNIIEDASLRCSIGSGYDVVCANIVADVLIAMSPFFAGFLKSDGRLITSGIIEKRFPEVLDNILKNGFTLTGKRQKDDWIACSFVKNA